MKLCLLVKNDSVNGKGSPSSATAAVPGQDGSPLTDTPVLSKFAADVGSQQFKSPRLQQLLGNRTAAAGTVKSSDGMVPAETEAGAAQVSATVTLDTDNNDETDVIAKV